MSAWLLPEDMAAIMGVSTRTVQRLCNEKRIPHWRIGRMLRFTPEQVAQIEAKYACEPIDPAVQAAVVAPNPAYKPNRAVLVDLDERRGKRPA